jgi:hypothetical protein
MHLFDDKIEDQNQNQAHHPVSISDRRVYGLRSIRKWMLLWRQSTQSDMSIRTHYKPSKLYSNDNNRLIF